MLTLTYPRILPPLGFFFVYPTSLPIPLILFQSASNSSFALLSNLSNIFQNTAPVPLNRSQADAIKRHAADLFECAVAAFEARPAGGKQGTGQSGRSTNDEKFLRSVLTSGTMSDKIAAMTILVKENPLLRLNTLDK